MPPAAGPVSQPWEMVAELLGYRDLWILAKCSHAFWDLTERRMFHIATILRRPSELKAVQTGEANATEVINDSGRR